MHTVKRILAALIIAPAIGNAQEIDTSSEGFLKQWHLHNSGQVIKGIPGQSGIDIGWLEALDRYFPKTDIPVAVIDTGCSLFHPDILKLTPDGELDQSILWINETEETGIEGVDDDKNGFIDDFFGWDFSSDIGLTTALDSFGHGTFVSSMINRLDDQFNGVGLCQEARIIAVKIQESGPELDSAKISASINYALQRGAKIANLSLSGPTFQQGNENLLREVSNHDILIVAAAGNKGQNIDIQPVYPAAYNVPSIISVGAINNRGQLAEFSNYGSTNVDITAPGEAVFGLVSMNKTMPRELIYGWGAYSSNFALTDWSVNFYPEDIPNNLWGAWWKGDAYLLGDSPGYNWTGGESTYDDNTNSYVLSKSIYLRKGSNPELNYGIYVDLSAGDYAYVYLHDKSGNMSLVKSYSPYTSGFEVVENYDLSALEGQNIQVSFHLVSNSDFSFNSNGVDIFDLRIMGDKERPLAEFGNGTSYAAPIVSGVAAMVWAHRPYLEALEVKQIILESAQKLPSLKGLVATEGMVRADKALELADRYHEAIIQYTIQDSVLVSDDWFYSDALGYLDTYHFEMIYTQSLGWAYIGSFNENGTFVYLFDEGWVFLNTQWYPFAYSFSKGTWIELK